MSAPSYNAARASAIRRSWSAIRRSWQQVVGQGRASNERNIPFENCPYTEEPNRTFWQRGWQNKPISQREAAELRKKGAAK